jgi:predicted transcriptional regulator of viral defense system
LLHERARSGWVRRLRRGLYVVDETHRGGPAPHPFAIATTLVESSAISHWSALAHHGLTEQIPRIVTASTTRDVVTPRMRGVTSRSDEPASTWEVDGLAIRYIRVQPDRFWGFEDVWVDELSRVRITDRERTVLDAFVSPSFFGSIGEVLGILEEHLSELDVQRLVSYGVRYGKDAAIKRLGYALEQFGADPDTIRPLRDAPVRGYRLLDPQGPDRGLYLAAWNLRDNLKVEWANGRRLLHAPASGRSSATLAVQPQSIPRESSGRRVGPDHPAPACRTPAGAPLIALRRVGAEDGLL